MENTNHKSRFTKWALIIALIIVLNLFFNYALSLVYKEPAYEDFCPNTQVVQSPTNQNECVALGGQWVENNYPVKPLPQEAIQGTAPIAQAGYCNINYTCDKNFQDADKLYSRNVFISLVLLGLVALICGIFVGSNEALSSGLAFGGVFSFVIASIRFWGAADNLIKVLILGITLAALIWLAIKKFGNK